MEPHEEKGADGHGPQLVVAFKGAVRQIKRLLQALGFNKHNVMEAEQKMQRRINLLTFKS